MATDSTPQQAAQRVSVLFVCLGNICRSPMAEGVFRHLTAFGTGRQQHPLIERIDSCGTGAYHAGDQPDGRTLSVLADNKITGYRHQARRVKIPQDLKDFDYILAMDDENLYDLRDMVERAVKKGSLNGDEQDRLYLYGSFGGRSTTEQVGDPYYGGRDGFEVAFEQVSRFAQGLLKHIEDRASADSKM